MALAPRVPANEYTVQVQAPHFVAGIVLDAKRQRCVAAAPVLKWAIGWPDVRLRDYFRARKWLAVVVPCLPEEGEVN